MTHRANPFDPAISGYPRDRVGYGRNPPDPRWPGGALIALNIVVNYEEGGESNLLHGDPGSVAFLTEHIVTPRLGERNLTAESLWEFGSRVGFWRLWRLLSRRALAVTCFGVTMAMARNPDAVAAMREAGWEIASHGMRWNIDPPADEAGERKEIEGTLALHEAICGEPALGWYNRSSGRTYRLLSEIGGMLYFADNYADELPFWAGVAGRAKLFVPYTLEAKRHALRCADGLRRRRRILQLSARQLRNVLYRDGMEGRPRMMSLGLHGRLAGRPGRTAGLERFLDHVARHDRVWIATRADIARHWRANFPPGELRTHW
jgi:peptidoglycan/xylan/chitin deacetylase (PgdA/CDA1 family)